VLRLGGGDMRRILNILQATNMAHDVVNETNVYLCTGNPLPSDMVAMCNWLWTESFEACVRQCLNLQKLKGYATMDLLQQVYLNANELELPPHARMYIYDQLAHLEHRLATGTSETLQLISLQQRRGKTIHMGTDVSASTGFGTTLHEDEVIDYELADLVLRLVSLGIKAMIGLVGTATSYRRQQRMCEAVEVLTLCVRSIVSTFLWMTYYQSVHLKLSAQVLYVCIKGIVTARALAPYRLKFGSSIAECCICFDAVPSPRMCGRVR
ncbi:hypothetical protein DYB28_010410, partial [Aphanomyces astaci]